MKLYDRIKERSYTIGTGNFALSGVFSGFSSFGSVYQNGEKFFYVANDGINFEIGSGIYISSSNQIQRFPIKSSNNDQKVNFPEGLKEVYVNYPATNSVFNGSGIDVLPTNSGLAFWTSSNSLSSENSFYIDSGNHRIGINKFNPSTAIDVGGSLEYSKIRASGFIVGLSGIYFPPANNNDSEYLGGQQLVHFDMNQVNQETGSDAVIELSGSVHQNILFKKQNAGTFFSGPVSGCSPNCEPNYPVFRQLSSEDIPDISDTYATIDYVFSILEDQIVQANTLEIGDFKITENYITTTVNSDILIIPTGSASVLIGSNNNTYSQNTLCNGTDNTIGNVSNFSTICGGSGNIITLSKYASILGGFSNSIDGDYGVINGGFDNSITSFRSTICGGSYNLVTNTDSNICGGNNNTINGSYSTVCGGYNNQVVQNNSVVVGGRSNVAYSAFNFIGGGSNNVTSGVRSAIAGGTSNYTLDNLNFIGAGLGNATSGNSTVVAGGRYNISAGYCNAIGGGLYNQCLGSSGNTIDGGQNNIIISGIHNTINGGFLNEASGNKISIVGGCYNKAYSDYTFIGGGSGNIAENLYSTVLNGTSNKSYQGGCVVNGNASIASGAFSFIGAGQACYVSGIRSVIVGGFINSSSKDFNFIGNGRQNKNDSSYGFIGCGRQNQTDSSYNFIGNGKLNYTSSFYSTILNGSFNKSVGQNSSIINGSFNSAISSDSLIYGSYNICAGSNSALVNDLSSSTTTITLLNANKNFFDDTTPNAIQIYYQYYTLPYSASFTIVSSVQDGDNVILELNNPIGPSSGSEPFRNIIVINSAISDRDYTNYGQSCLGGNSNFAKGLYSTIIGGLNNYTKGISSSIISGENNKVFEQNSSIIGSLASTNNGFNSVICGGQNHTSSSYYSSILGGSNNSCSNYGSTVVGGSFNQSNGLVSVVAGGYFNINNSDFGAIIGGQFAECNHFGEISHSSGKFSNNGDAQHSILVARGVTNNDETIALTLDGQNTLSINNTLSLPIGAAWNFEVKLSAMAVDFNDSNIQNGKGAGWNIKGLIYRPYGVISTPFTSIPVLVNSIITETFIPTEMSSANVTVSVDSTNSALQINVTGIGNNIDVNWVAVVDITQVIK